MFILRNYTRLVKETAISFSLTLLLFIQPVLGANLVTDISGTWSTKAGCDRLAAMMKDPDAAWKGDFENMSYLTKDGIEGYEWGCHFIKGYPGPNGETVYISACSMEGESWSELLMVEKDRSGRGGWVVTNKDIKGQIVRDVYDQRCSRN